MAELPQGIYELYYADSRIQAPLGLDTVDGQPPQVVQLPAGTPAPRWTVTKVADNTFTFSIGGAFVAPSGIWVEPSSEAYGWKVNKVYTVPSPGGESSYAVWLPDMSRGWNYLVLGGRRNVIPRQANGELLIWLYPGAAYPWWFKRVA
ncbi:hypothetical protein Hypma_015418 [Hypsizygus marmoreus]|uniref:Uncharacterized protein n=1 Tax=Hypsizygus marmoreus TaxID=39966 RepID=A0A369KBR8_HYPMA|nr:hypothetical protein Hypma_015418 [Hypsizygus marmoreus]